MKTLIKLGPDTDPLYLILEHQGDDELFQCLYKLREEYLEASVEFTSMELPTYTTSEILNTERILG